jgi:hypothetical protein
MVKSVEGIYRNGKVELVDPLPEAEGSRVIVTWSRIPRLEPRPSLFPGDDSWV